MLPKTRRWAWPAALMIALLFAPSAAAAPRCATPAFDPDASDVREAMHVVGLSDGAPVPIAKAIDEDCFPGTELALYDNLVRVILVGDRWREVGGLTRLIHEMKHYADDITGLSAVDECGATRAAAAWAEAHGYFNEARRERRYGAGFCEADTIVMASSTPNGTGDTSEGGRFLRMASVLFLPPDD